MPHYHLYVALLRVMVATADAVARLSSVANNLEGAFIFDKGDCGIAYIGSPYGVYYLFHEIFSHWKIDP